MALGLGCCALGLLLIVPLYLTTAKGSPSVAAQPRNQSTVSDVELVDLGKRLWLHDDNHVSVTYQLQNRVVGNNPSDTSTQSLFARITDPAWNRTTLVAFRRLLDNYYREANRTEDLTPAELREIDVFVTEVMNTRLMQTAFQFLANRSLVPSNPTDFRAWFKDLWFTLYRRERHLSSSSFEHVFVGEIVRGEVSGLHNWIQYYLQEQAGNINYYGYGRILPLGDRAVIRNIYTWGNFRKPIGSFFIGTSPEFELAVYTTCFAARGSAPCHLTLNEKQIPIRVYIQSYHNKRHIGSAYPSV